MKKKKNSWAKENFIDWMFNWIMLGVILFLLCSIISIGINLIDAVAGLTMEEQVYVTYSLVVAIFIFGAVHIFLNWIGLYIENIMKMIISSPAYIRNKRKRKC